MPITNDTQFINDFVGPNRNIGTFGPPEVPSLTWGNNGGGYINDFPTDKGGWTTQNSIARIFPWGVVMSIQTYNPAGKNFRVQLRNHRSYIRRRSDKVWVEQPYSVSAQNVDTPFYYQFPGDLSQAIPSTSKASAPSGGTYHLMINDWCLHPFEQDMVTPNYTTYDCWGGTLQARLVPINNATDFAWEDAEEKVGVNTGADNYKAAGQPDPWVGEHCHNAFSGLTNRWTVTASATVKRPDGWPDVSNKPNQGAGITLVDYQSGDPLPQPPEEEVWIEKGVYNATTNMITMHVYRSAAVSTDKTYDLSRYRGNITYPAIVTITTGNDTATFEVEHPGTGLTLQQCCYISDGGEEDHWATFTLNDEASPGPAPAPGPGGSDDTVRHNYMLNSEDLSVGNGSNITVSSASNPPDGVTSWQTLTGGATHNGGIARFCNVPNGAFVQSFYLKAGNVNFALIKIEPNTYNKAEWIWVNLTNGAVTQHTTNMPFPTTAIVEEVETGIYRVGLATTLNEGVPIGFELSPCTGTDSWVSAPSGTIIAGGIQCESGSLMTHYKPTTTAVVTRTLTDVDLELASSTLGVAQFQNVTITVTDDQGEPWDQVTVTLASTNAGVCNFEEDEVVTDSDGIATGQLNGITTGSAGVTATVGTVDDSEGIIVDASLTPIEISNSSTLLEFLQTVAVENADEDPEPPPAIDVGGVQQILTFTQSVTAAIITSSSTPSVPTMIVGKSGVSPIVLVGTGTVGAEIDIYVDGVLQSDTVEVDADGVWSTTLDLDEGTYSIYALQIVDSVSSAITTIEEVTILATGVGSGRFRSGSGTGPRKAIRPTKPPKMNSWPTR